MSEMPHTTNTDYFKWHNSSVFHVKECINSLTQLAQLHGSLTLSLAPSIFCSSDECDWNIYTQTWNHVRKCGQNIAFTEKKSPLQIGTVPKLSGAWKTDFFTLGTEHISCLFFFFFLSLFFLFYFFFFILTFSYLYESGEKISSKQ